MLAGRQRYVENLKVKKDVMTSIKREFDPLDAILQKCKKDPVTLEPAIRAEIEGLKTAIDNSSDDLDNAYRRCFVDANGQQMLTAKIGVVGLEKAGKSTFLSGWTTNGGEARLLPSVAAVCTGTVVRMYSVAQEGRGLPTFRAVVEFFTVDEILKQVASLILCVCDKHKEMFSSPDFKATKIIIDKGKPEEQTTASALMPLPNLRELMSELNNNLTGSSNWQDLLQEDNAENKKPDVSAAVLLSKLMAGWDDYRSKLGRNLDIKPTDSVAKFGDDLWQYISVVNERGGAKADKFTENYLPLAVRSVSIYGPLPGLAPDIEINDLPGLDSASPELNKRTLDAYKTMDILVFVKNPNVQAQLRPSEMALLQRIRAEVDPEMKRVLVLINAFDTDLAQTLDADIKTKIAAQSLLRMFGQINKERIVFGGAFIMDPDRRFSADAPNSRTKVVYDSLIQDQFQIDKDNLNGFKRFTTQLKLMVNGMTSRDAEEANRLTQIFQSLVNSISSLSARLAPYVNTSMDDVADTLVNGNERQGKVGILQVIQANILSTIDDSARSTLLPHRGTLMYYDQSMFIDDPIPTMQPDAIREPLKAFLWSRAKDKDAFPAYFALFQENKPWTPAQLREALVAAIAEQVNHPVDPNQPHSASATTSQLIEDQLYLDQIRLRLSEDHAKSVGNDFANQMRDWLLKMKGFQPITFAGVESYYRLTVRNYFALVLTWIQRIDSANVLSTLDHLIDVVLLSSLPGRQEEGSLLSLFAHGTSGQQDDLAKFLIGIKVNLYDNHPRVLHAGAMECLNLLLGVQRERLSTDEAIAVPKQIQDSEVNLAHHMRATQRASYKALILEPCGYAICKASDRCKHIQHKGALDWEIRLKTLKEKKDKLLSTLTEQETSIKEEIKCVETALVQLGVALTDAAIALDHLASATAKIELSDIGVRFPSSGNNITSPSGPQTLLSPTLPPPPPPRPSSRASPRPMNSSVDLSQADALKRSVTSLQSKLESEQTTLATQRKVYTSMMKWLRERAAHTTFGHSKYTELITKLIPTETTLNENSEAASKLHVRLPELDRQAAQLQSEIDALDAEPGLKRKAFLESLFVVPMTFTQADLDEIPESNTQIGKGAAGYISAGEEQVPVPLTVRYLLTRKQKLCFIEQADLQSYPNDIEDRIKLFECYPTPGGQEEKVLLQVIHIRTMKALEHVNELISDVIEKVSSLKTSRALVVKNFSDALALNKNALSAQFTSNRATLWPQIFARAETMKTMAAVVKRIESMLNGQGLTAQNNPGQAYSARPVKPARG